MLLLGSLLVLFLGPVLFRLAARRAPGLASLDGFLFVAIGGLVVFDVLPEAFSHGGWWIVVPALLGLLGPSALERFFAGIAGPTHRVAILLGLGSLTLHALADGAVLWGVALPGSGESQSLGLAILLHRLPVGLTIWWLLRPGSGRLAAGAALLWVGLSTVIGFSISEVFLSGLSSWGLGQIKALAGGALLHVVFHPTQLKGHLKTASSSRVRLAAGLGALLGLSLMIVTSSWGRPDSGLLGSTLFHSTLWTLLLESAPALLLAYLLAGALTTWIPGRPAAWINRGSNFGQSVRGMVVGLPLPVCSCGVVPLYRSLSKQGAASGGAIAFLIATPELSLDALILSWPLLGGWMTAGRLVAAAAVALMVGVLVGRLYPNPSSPISTPGDSVDDCCSTPPSRLKGTLRAGLVDLVDETAPWIVVGLVVAAALQPLLNPDWVTAIPSWVQVPVFALLGIPMYVCASGATPLMAVLLIKGISPGAALAFLLTGPATNLTTFGVVASALGRRPALVFALATLAAAVACGYLVNLVDLPVQPVDLSDGHESRSWFKTGSAGLLLLLFVGSLLRLGPRGFVGEVFRIQATSRK